MSEPIVLADETRTRSQYAVCWTWPNDTVSHDGTHANRAQVEKLLEQPPAGVIGGELVHRTVTEVIRRTATLSDWAPAPDAPGVQHGLFAQPDYEYSVRGFPPEMVRDTKLQNGMRYLFLGDDGDTIVVLGHPVRIDLDTLPWWLDVTPNSEPEYTWARLLFSCPDHDHRKPELESCWMCRDTEHCAWVLDWNTVDGQEPEVNALKDGYFPITVWEVES